MRRRERSRAGHRDQAGLGHERELRAGLEDEIAGVEDRAGQFLVRHPRSARTATVADAIARRQGAHQLSLVASGAAFWLVISAFPTAIAVVSLYGLIVDPRQVASDLGTLANAAPASLGSLIVEQLQRVAATDSTGPTIGLAVSLALALWSASTGIYNLDRAIRDAYGLSRQRYVDARVRSFAQAAVIVVALGAVAVATAATMGHSHGLAAVGVAVPSSFVAIVAVVTGLYRFAVGRPMGLRALLPGALAAAAGMVVVLVAFGAYASASTHFTAVYGVFGAAVIGMIATYLAVYMILLGAVLNAELERRRAVPSSARDRHQHQP